MSSIDDKTIIIFEKILVTEQTRTQDTSDRTFDVSVTLFHSYQCQRKDKESQSNID